MFTGNTALLNQNVVPVVENKIEINAEAQADPNSVKALVIEYYKEDPILAEVAFCESTFTHYLEDGSVLRGKVDNRDVGVMQINTYYHGDTAERFGYDLETLEGNLGYAKNLYERQGLQPWSASSKCWSKSLHLASNVK